jgi:hypothetical protein
VHAFTALAMWQVIGCASILLLRTRAVYQGNRIITGILVSLLLAEVIGMLWVAVVDVPLAIPDALGPCLPVSPQSQPHIVAAYFAIPMVFDTTVTALIVYKAVAIIKKGTHSSIIDTLLRDGVIYFLAISGANLLNVAFYAQGDPLYQPVCSAFAVMMTAILGCRLSLQLRKAPTTLYVGSRGNISRQVQVVPSNADGGSGRLNDNLSTRVIAADQYYTPYLQSHPTKDMEGAGVPYGVELQQLGPFDV